MPNWNTSFAPLEVPRGVNAGAVALTLFMVEEAGLGVLFIPVLFGARSGMKGDCSDGDTRFE